MELEGFNNYLIYPDGRVQNKKTKRYLKQSGDGGGYLQLRIGKDKIKHTFKIHRLVALYYIPNPDNKRCVDHINRNRSDNRIENLRWVTDEENSQNRGATIANKLGIKNICYDKSGDRYYYQKKMKGVKHSKYFKILEEAVEYKKEYENYLKSP
tara:strand:- start:38 stop:499 length:462 start_codon:yes stop_codon:yes gene_type:complete